MPCHTGFNGMLRVSAQNTTKDLSGVHHQEHAIGAHPLCCVGKAPLQVSGRCLCATASSALCQLSDVHASPLLIVLSGDSSVVWSAGPVIKYRG